MYGPPRTHREVAATVDHAVGQLTAQGLSFDSAVRLVAQRYELERWSVVAMVNPHRRQRR